MEKKFRSSSIVPLIFFWEQRIIIPDTAKEKPQEGKVVAVGPGTLKDGKVIPLEVKAGDKILFRKYAGTEIKLNGEDHLIMREGDVLRSLKNNRKTIFSALRFLPLAQWTVSLGPVATQLPHWEPAPYFACCYAYEEPLRFLDSRFREAVLPLEEFFGSFRGENGKLQSIGTFSRQSCIVTRAIIYLSRRLKSPVLFKVRGSSRAQLSADFQQVE